jgi:hypothetical protein
LVEIEMNYLHGMMINRSRYIQQTNRDMLSTDQDRHCPGQDIPGTVTRRCTGKPLYRGHTYQVRTIFSGKLF